MTPQPPWRGYLLKSAGCSYGWSDVPSIEGAAGGDCSLTPAAGGSARVSAARSRATTRLIRQRDTLRPLGLAVMAIVTVSAAASGPRPAWHGRGLGVGACVVAFCALLAVSTTGWFVERRSALQVTVLAGMGAAGALLAAAQPQGGAAQLAGGAAVWMVAARLPLPVGGALAAGITAALAVAIGIAGGSPSSILSISLLCALLGVVAVFLRQGREGQARTELLLAELEDAREEQTRAAAIAERGRIAAELHDVLAHSLSGAAIQLQGARLLAERDAGGAGMRTAIDRAAELVRDGLVNARQAVGALRGEATPGVEEVASLVETARADLDVDLTFAVEGVRRRLPADAGLALYRGAQEALTNIARHARGARASVLLRYQDGQTTLTIENGPPPPAATTAGGDLHHAGGGRGLDGLRERLVRVGGSVTAGPTESGWRVELQVPV